MIAVSFILARSRRQNCFSCSISMVRLDLAACLSFSVTQGLINLVLSVEDLAISLLQVDIRLTRTKWWFGSLHRLIMPDIWLETVSLWPTRLYCQHTQLGKSTNRVVKSTITALPA